MMSSSDYETSASSNIHSPQTAESPFSSPSQQVPQLANILTELSCTDSKFTRLREKDGLPFLRITEQPQDHFRFRYLSEMNGTHGCIFGRSHLANKTKTHPTVELVNYNRPAIIQCSLAEHNVDKDHPHKLFDDESGRYICKEVPINGQYKVPFPDMGVIHNSKKEVTNWLYEKYGGKFSMKQCENMGKAINKNIVRLRFSAHDVITEEEICPPVFSDPIHNMKSAATNDLKICRLSQCNGTPDGGDDVIILCEKVNKKDIKIRFFEMENGERVWEKLGNFMPTDVHHQYAITFRTPAYENTKIESNVTVYVELYRPSDGRVSDATEFTYIANKVHKIGKKRRADHSLSSLGSSTDGSINSLRNLPVIVANHVSLPEEDPKTIPKVAQIGDIPYQNIINQQNYTQPTGDLLGNALHSAIGSGDLAEPESFFTRSEFAKPFEPTTTSDAALGQLLPNIQMDSEEFNRILTNEYNMSEDDKRRFIHGMDWDELTKFSLPEISRQFSKEWVADSGRAKGVEATPSTSNQPSTCHQMAPPPLSRLQKSPLGAMDLVNKTSKEENKVKAPKEKETIEYNAFYSAEEGAEVKKIVKELVSMIRNKTGHKKQDVRMKLERLFEMRLSNGDTFLHMTLCSNQPSMEYIVKMIHSWKMTHLLNLQNHNYQTVLHLAILHDMPKHVSFLVANGSDPMIADYEENNAIHFAVICNNCLEPLLKAIKTSSLHCDLNARNGLKQTALHGSAIQGSASNIKLLIENGADYTVCDREGRTAFHLAAYDGHIEVLRVMLEFVKESDVDATDNRGNTVLQILCGRDVKDEISELIQLLLDKKADPMKHEANSYPAWKLAHDKPQIFELIKKYIKDEIPEDMLSEAEDEYESADEGELPTGLSDLDSYIEEISPLLDDSNAWLQLAATLEMEAPLLNLEGKDKGSPAKQLLLRIKEKRESVTSSFLADLLEKLGEKEVANIIRKRITDKSD